MQQFIQGETMYAPPLKVIVVACTMCTTAACSQPASGPAAASGTDAAAASAPSTDGARKTAAIDGKTFCPRLQSAIQRLVNVPPTLHEASDSMTDKMMHMGERNFVDCDFRQRQTQVDISLHDDSDHHLFDDPNEKGYAPLSGFGDRARSASAMGEHWVDVVRGSVACEARLGLEDDGQVKGDWKQAAGRMCDAAFAVR
jgi:hypothetical protein